MSALVFAIPSKGRLKEQAETFLADCGLRLTLEARGYTARIKSAPNVDVRLMSSSEIADALRSGAVHAGICGEDLLREIEPAMTRIALARALGFGPADLVVAAPKSWVDVRTMADLDAVCHDYRARTGKRLRVATKYQALTRAFFDAHGLDDYRVVQSDGATEGAPAAGAAEAIVDITTTGATLAANHLKILEDGVILKSQAQIAISRASVWDDGARRALEFILGVIEARLRAKSWRRVRARFDGSSADFAAVANKYDATIIGAENMSDIECRTEDAPAVAAALVALGVRDVTVESPDYLFSAQALSNFHDTFAMMS